MSSSPTAHKESKLSDPTKQEQRFGLSIPVYFATATALLVALYDWPRRWIIGGAPLLTFFILLGSSKGYRILPFVPLWTLLATLHLVYAVAATSWLLYAVFLVGCYWMIFLTCLFQFDSMADFARRFLRLLLKQLHFFNDKIAFFDLPALEIDTDVDGLLVVRGLTFSLSTLTIVAHGVEVGIKLSDDMELAIQTETVKITLFRRIEVDDCYANIKGGAYEMTFGDVDVETEEDGGDAVMVEDTPLLKAAAAYSEARPRMTKMASRFTGGGAPKDSSAKSVFQSTTQLSPDDQKAREKYQKTLQWIEETNMIHQCRKSIDKQASTQTSGQSFDYTNDNDIRAAICSRLHHKPSVPHPPRRSIKVTTLQNLMPPRLREFMHRLPMLLRLLLNPLSYFHPVSIASITASGSGKWITQLLKQHVFEHYGQESHEIRRLEGRVSSWLSDANFAFQVADITGLAHVPFLTTFDIVCQIFTTDLMAYRLLSKEVDLKQVLRLGGADASFHIPSYLLPHHEHILPPIPTAEDKEYLKEDIDQADGMPHAIQKEQDLKLAEKDDANVRMSVHARLPACIDQELLNFSVALGKASKVVEQEKEPSPMDHDISGIKDFTVSLHKGVKESMKKVTVDNIANDKLIARLIGKIMKRLETLQGDVGYSGDIPVALATYRLPEGSKEATKLLA